MMRTRLPVARMEPEACIDARIASSRVAFVAAILLGQKLHGEVDALEFAAGDGEIAGLLGAAAKQDGVEAFSERLDGDIDADVRVGLEDDAFGPHLLDAAVDDVLFKLEVGNAVAEKAADAVGFLEDGDGVAGAAKLLRGGETGGTAADDGDALAGGLLGRLGMNPALVPGAIDDGPLDELDGDGRLVDAQHAGGFAGSGADAARELREVIRRVEAANGGLPTVVVDEIVPVGDEIVDRAAGVAEGHAAVHAASALLALLFFGEWLVDFEPVANALIGLAARGLFPLNLKKACDLTHVAPRLRQPPPEATRSIGEA